MSPLPCCANICPGSVSREAPSGAGAGREDSKVLAHRALRIRMVIEGIAASFPFPAHLPSSQPPPCHTRPADWEHSSEVGALWPLIHWGIGADSTPWASVSPVK